MLQLLEGSIQLIRRLQKRLISWTRQATFTEEDLTRSGGDESKLMEWREENAQASFIQETGMRISQVSDRWRRSSEVWRRDSWRESTRESTRASAACSGCGGCGGLRECSGQGQGKDLSGFTTGGGRAEAERLSPRWWLQVIWCS